MADRLLAVEQSLDLWAVDKNGNTALHYACGCSKPGDPVFGGVVFHNDYDGEDHHKSDAQTIKLLVEADIDDAETIKLLVEAGIDVSTINKDGDTALHVAVRKKNITAVNALLDLEAAVNVKNKEEDTALHIAVRTEECLVEPLLKKGADPNIQNNVKGQTPLHLAVIPTDIISPSKSKSNQSFFNFSSPDQEKVEDYKFTYRSETMPYMLVSYGAQCDIKCKSGCTPLLIAISCWPDNLAMTMLDSADIGDEINVPFTEGIPAVHTRMTYSFPPSHYTGLNALHIAVYENKVQLVQRLIQAGAAVNAKNKKAETCLDVAIEKNFTDIAVSLIANKADIDVGTGSPPLQMAVKRCNIAIVKCLIANEVNINAVSEYSKDTALCIAIKQESLDMAKFLLENKADVNIADGSTNTPLHLAIACSKDKVDKSSILILIKSLITNGADINRVNGPHKETALCVAIRSKCLDIVKFLIENKADVNIADNNGCTPLHLAVHYKTLDVVKILLQLKNSKGKQ